MARNSTMTDMKNPGGFGIQIGSSYPLNLCTFEYTQFFHVRKSTVFVSHYRQIKLPKITMQVMVVFELQKVINYVSL